MSSLWKEHQHHIAAQGTPEGNKAALAKANETAVWRGKCHKCGQPLSGTLVQLQEHVCAPRQS